VELNAIPDLDCFGDLLISFPAFDHGLPELFTLGENLARLVIAICAKGSKTKPRAIAKPAPSHNFAAPTTNKIEPVRKKVSSGAPFMAWPSRYQLHAAPINLALAGKRTDASRFGESLSLRPEGFNRGHISADRIDVAT
jgi:hypothetical protein